MNSHRFTQRHPTQAETYAALPKAARAQIDHLASNPWGIESIASLAALIATHGPKIVALVIAILETYKITVPSWVTAMLTCWQLQPPTPTPEKPAA